MMPIVGAYLLAILYRIATEGHSRAVTITMLHLVGGKTLLNQAHHLFVGEKLITAYLHILFREANRSSHRLLLGQFLGHINLSREPVSFGPVNLTQML